MKVQLTSDDQLRGRCGFRALAMTVALSSARASKLDFWLDAILKLFAEPQKLEVTRRG